MKVKDMSTSTLLDLRWSKYRFICDNTLGFAKVIRTKDNEVLISWRIHHRSQESELRAMIDIVKSYKQNHFYKNLGIYIWLPLIATILVLVAVANSWGMVYFIEGAWVLCFIKYILMSIPSDEDLRWYLNKLYPDG